LRSRNRTPSGQPHGGGWRPGLDAHGVTIVSLCPFIVTTEVIMAKKKSQALARWMESRQFVGRARQLALDYGRTDIDGHVPTLPPTPKSSDELILV
jgi:hypothetical protein